MTECLLMLFAAADSLRPYRSNGEELVFKKLQCWNEEYLRHRGISAVLVYECCHGTEGCSEGYSVYLVDSFNTLQESKSSLHRMFSDRDATFFESRTAARLYLFNSKPPSSYKETPEQVKDIVLTFGDTPLRDEHGSLQEFPIALFQQKKFDHAERRAFMRRPSEQSLYWTFDPVQIVAAASTARCMFASLRTTLVDRGVMSQDYDAFTLCTGNMLCYTGLEDNDLLPFRRTAEDAVFEKLELWNTNYFRPRGMSAVLVYECREAIQDNGFAIYLIDTPNIRFMDMTWRTAAFAQRRDGLTAGQLATLYLFDTHPPSTFVSNHWDIVIAFDNTQGIVEEYYVDPHGSPTSTDSSDSYHTLHTGDSAPPSRSTSPTGPDAGEPANPPSRAESSF
ncbi:hypothetical protein GGG16DRAFT_107872 [Schizophyllum commune]